MTSTALLGEDLLDLGMSQTRNMYFSKGAKYYIFILLTSTGSRVAVKLNGTIQMTKNIRRT